MTNKTCQDCHAVCKAKCCTTVSFRGLKKRYRRGSFVELKIPGLTEDIRWYYELHNIYYNNGVLSFIIMDHEYVNGSLIVTKRCKYLTEDLRCEGHPDKKPLICQKLGPESKHDKMIYITPGCMYE